MSEYDKKAIKELADDLLEKGLRVFLAERGTYGFYTDQSGERTVSFQADLGGVNFGGKYEGNREGGTGWQLETGDYETMLQTMAPRWAMTSKPTYTTLDMYLKSYQSSSKFTEYRSSASTN